MTNKSATSSDFKVPTLTQEQVREARLFQTAFKPAQSEDESGEDPDYDF